MWGKQWAGEGVSWDLKQHNCRLREHSVSEREEEDRVGRRTIAALSLCLQDEGPDAGPVRGEQPRAQGGPVCISSA